jgi:phenylpyruvate tautomerase PptA (4-oxalocrotonate tautomerase family)
MPLVRITVPRGMSEVQRGALGRSVHQALVDVANVPAEDRFQVIEELPPENLSFSSSYLGLAHEGPMVFVQVTLNAGRSVEVKKALYARIAEGVHAACGARREDVIVSLLEVARENWSFGGGSMSYPPASG